jgi:hypothetical protein
MKRYVIFAVIMLLGLNSCVVDYGTDRRPNRDKVLLVNQVRNTLAYGVEYLPYAMYANAYFSSDEQAVVMLKARYFSDVTIEIEGNNMLFTGRYNKYLLETNGQPLSQDGEWKLWRYWNSSGERILSVTYMGVAEVENCFKVCCSEFGYYEVSSVDAEVVYDIDVEKSYIEAEIGGSGRIEQEGSFMIEFSIDDEHPLISSMQRNQYTGGEMDITYTDLVTGKQKLASVTFLSSGKYRFD